MSEGARLRIRYISPSGCLVYIYIYSHIYKVLEDPVCCFEHTALTNAGSTVVHQLT